MMRFRAGVGLMAATLLAGCGETTVPPVDGGPERVVNPQVVQAYTGFGLKLFREVAGEAGERNVFLSPTSIALALAMTQNGAAGGTLEAMSGVLETGGLTIEAVNEANDAWLGAMAAPDPKVELSIANSLWARQGVPLLPAFLERTRTTYRAEVETLDFGTPQASRTINQWVSESTRGRIPEIVPARIDPRTVLYLINAIYFKGSWSDPFDPRLTRPGDWHLPGGGVRSVPMMQRTGEYRLLDGDGFQGVALPYGGGRLAMYIFLPDEGSDVAALRERLVLDEWGRWLDGFRAQRAFLSLPRFKLSYEVGLVEPLRALGMDVAFDGAKADFGAMFPREYLAINNAFISDVKHKTFLEVNELGTEAAGATSVEISVTSMPPSVVVDRPFLVAIRDDRTGTVLFLGQIVDPS